MTATCSLYVITNLLNNKQYIGVSKNVANRFKQHANPNKKTRSIITNAIQQHGIENFSIKVLVIADQKYCYELEKKLIDSWGTQTPNGYNICKGGVGATGLAGALNGMYGRTGDLNPQYGKTGENSAFFGRKHSDDTKLKMRLAHLGRKKSEEQKQKIKELAIERWKDPQYRQKVMEAKYGNKEIS